jgi:hypothetical protein
MAAALNLALLDVLQPGIEDLLDPVQSGAPQHLDLVEAQVHVGAISLIREFVSFKRLFKSPIREFTSPKRAWLIRIPMSTVIVVGSVVSAMVRTC